MWCEQKMNERSRDEASPQLLDLISNEREWQMNKRNEGKSSEERKLELRLGPPGEDWSLGGKMKNTEREESLLSLGCFSPNINSNAFQSKASHPWPNYHHHGQGNNKKASSSSFLQFPSSTQPVMMGKDASCPKVVVELQQNGGDGKVFSPSSANTAVSQPNTSQKRYSTFFLSCIHFLLLFDRGYSFPESRFIFIFSCLWSMQTNLWPPSFYLSPYIIDLVFHKTLVALLSERKNNWSFPLLITITCMVMLSTTERKHKGRDNF